MNRGYRDMHRLQDLVRLHREGRSTREIARLLSMSPNTERRLRIKLRDAGLLVGDELPDLDTLRAAVVADDGEARRRPPQEVSSIAAWRPYIEPLIARDIGPTAIFGVLREQHVDFHGTLSAVKRMVAQMTADRGPRAEDVAIPVITTAGEVGQVDFGYAGLMRDPATGKDRKTWFFVMVLGHSRHMFARLVFDQSAPTWLALHAAAFASFGGVPRAIVPDNLKAAVIRAAFGVDDPSGLNRSYREMARHYGFVVDPAPVRAPQKKGKVEAGVKYVFKAFLEPRTFADIDDANRQLRTWVIEVAGRRTHGTTGQPPLAVFEATERSALLPLPPKAWQVVTWRTLMVGRNTHVAFAGAFWSVPWKHICAQVLVRATDVDVQVFHEDHRIATHARMPPRLWHTDEQHLPEGRRDQRHRDRAWWEARADVLGDGVGAYIRAVFDADEVDQPIRRVHAILRTLEAVSPERAQAACARAARFGNFKADGVRGILERGLDLEPAPSGAVSTTWATRPAFARQAEEFLLALEVTHGTC